MKTVYLSTVILNHVLRGIPYTPATTVYIALHTTMPTLSTPGVEVFGGSYTRQPVLWSAPVFGSAITSSNASDVDFPVATAPWGDIVGYSLWDAPTGGNMLMFSPMTAPRSVLIGDQPRFLTGQLIAQES